MTSRRSSTARRACSPAQARELWARSDAERSGRRTALPVVDRPHWWERTSIQDTVSIAETAQAWKGHDPITERAAAVVQREVLDRDDIDTAVLCDAGGQEKSELDLAKE